MINSVYVLIKPSSVTTRLLNLSTSFKLNEAATLPDGRVVLEFPESAKPEVLDYTWYSAKDVSDIRQDQETNGVASPWWWPF